MCFYFYYLTKLEGALRACARARNNCFANFHNQKTLKSNSRTNCIS